MAAISGKVQMSAVADIWKWHVVRLFLGRETHIVRNANAQPLSHYQSKMGKSHKMVAHHLNGHCPGLRGLEPVREVLNADQELASLRMSNWMMAR